ncbi:MAG TPA: DUF3006 domain-containing protein [Armatimonadota bacterium]|jgi:hypothetical protein
MPNVRTRVFLDRIEGDLGVIVAADGRSVDVPLAWLPEGIRGGAELTVTVAEDPHATTEGRAQAASLIDELIRRSET